jgi:hypothetical protein
MLISHQNQMTLDYMALNTCWVSSILLHIEAPVIARSHHPSFLHANLAVSRNSSSHLFFSEAVSALVTMSPNPCRASVMLISQFANRAF